MATYRLCSAAFGMRCVSSAFLRRPVLKPLTFTLRPNLHARALHQWTQAACGTRRNLAEPGGTRRNHHQMTPSDNFGILRGPVLKARTFILRQRLHARALHRQDPNIMRNQAEPGGTRRNQAEPRPEANKSRCQGLSSVARTFRRQLLYSKYQLFAVDPRQRPPSAPVQYGIGSSNSNSIIHPTQDNTGSTAVQIPKPRGAQC